MTLQDVVRAVAKEDLHDLLTPLAVVVALEVAAKTWDDSLTKKYGSELRDRVIGLARQMPI